MNSNNKIIILLLLATSMILTGCQEKMEADKEITATDTNLQTSSKQTGQPNFKIYEDNKASIYVEKDCVYVYDKVNKVTKGNIDLFFPAEDTMAITNDAVYISNNESIVYRIILNTLEIEEFYKSINTNGEGDSLAIYIVNEKYCVIGNNNKSASHQGMTIINTTDIKDTKDIEDGKLIYGLNNKAYCIDDDNNLQVIDLTNGLDNIAKETLVDSISGYVATQDNNIIFESKGQLIKVDNDNDNTEYICDDFDNFIEIKDDEVYYSNTDKELVRIYLSSSKKDVIGDNFYNKVNISDIKGQTVILYMDSNHDLIRIDEDSSIVTDNIHLSFKATNDILVFTKETKDGKQIKDTVYFYEIDEDKVCVIKLGKNNADISNLEYYVDDEKITIKIDNKTEWSSRIDNINWSIKKEIYLD